MHERKKINNYWISRYSVRKVFFRDSFYNQTIKYLKKQRYLRFSKVSAPAETKSSCHILPSTHVAPNRCNFV